MGVLLQARMAERLSVSGHAVDRYQERVDKGASKRVARDKILRMLEAAELEPEGEISRYLYPNKKNPELVMVVKDGTVLTLVRPNKC